MQNKYFGDIHDFYKYYLLRHISDYFSLGIHWCLVPNEDSKDGNKKLSQKEKCKDTRLFDLLNNSKNKDINSIKQYFPMKTKYFTDIHQYYHLNNLYMAKAFEKLNKQDVIFFDPDNGLEVSSTNNKNKYKYISYGSIENYWKNGNSIIIYQHLGRVQNQFEDKIEKITEALSCNKIGNINILKKGNASYIFILQKKHYLMHDIIPNFVSHNKEYEIIEV